MVGAGTSEDPRRPAYAPVPTGTPSTDGIIAFSDTVSDDRQFALVEFVGRNRDAFKELLADNNPAIKCSSKARQTVRYHSRFPKTEEEYRRRKPAGGGATTAKGAALGGKPGTETSNPDVWNNWAVAPPIV